MTTVIHAMPKRQRGVVLAISLIVLLVITLLGVTAMQSTLLQERMAGNTREVSMAFQAAEAALRDGEKVLAALTAPPTTCSTAPCSSVWARDVLAEPAAQIASWWTTNGQEYGVDASQEITEGVDSDPYFVIEELDFIPDSLRLGHGVPVGRHYYRTAAHGVSASQTSRSVVESTFVRRF